MDARIRIVENTDAGLTERLLRWRWWWQVYIPDHGIRSGFASTRDRAQAKAEKAARRLAATRASAADEYTIHIHQHRP